MRTCSYGPGDPVFYGTAGRCTKPATVTTVLDGRTLGTYCGPDHARRMTYRRYGDVPTTGRVQTVPTDGR